MCFQREQATRNPICWRSKVHSNVKEKLIYSFSDGISWIKFQYYDSTDGQSDVPLIPCGIVYLNKDRWRSPVVIQYEFFSIDFFDLFGRYGKPIYLTKERLEAYRYANVPKLNCCIKNFCYRQDPKKEVKNFTTEVEHVMYQLTLNSPDWETMKLAHAARRLYMGGNS